MKLHLKQHKRYIAENNYFFRTSGDMWFDVMNQYEGTGKVSFMTRLFKIYSIYIDFVIMLNVGWKVYCKLNFLTQLWRILFTFVVSSILRLQVRSCP